MGLKKTVRVSDSPYLRAVTLYQCDADDTDLAVPDESWDLVTMKQGGRRRVLLTGQTTKAVSLKFSPGDEFVTLSFRASVFLRNLPAEGLVDQGTLLPMFTGRTFRLGADPLVGVLSGHPPAASPRSVQRHFQRTTGLPFYQIRRARDAVSRLLKGTPAADAALDAGYADQAHMIRSLKRIWGQTPGEFLARFAPR